MKPLWIVGGVLCALFAIAQLAQFLGLIGVGGNLAGIAFILLGAAGAIVCFKKAFASGRRRRRR